MTTVARFFDSESSDRIYTSADLADVLASLAGDGYVPDRGDELAVTAADPAALSVVVGTGHAWIQGRNVEVTAAETLEIAIAPGFGLSRIDLVVAYVDYTNRTGGVKVVTGTAAGSPTAPAVTEEADEWQIALAEVLVTDGDTSIVDGAITARSVSAVPERAKAHGIAASTFTGSAGGWVDAATTPGPLVEVTVPDSGVVLVHLSGRFEGPSGGSSYMAFDLTGANTMTATAVVSAYGQLEKDDTGFDRRFGQFYMTGLSPGATTFTVKYKTDSGDQLFLYRVIRVEALP